MSDPVINSPESTVLGIKLISLVSGFMGGVISLSFVKELSKPQALAAVITGALSAGYLTPVVTYYLPHTLPELSVSFLVGLTAMNLIPGIIKLSELFKKNPQDYIPGGGSK